MDPRIDFLYLSEQDMIKAGVTNMAACIPSMENMFKDFSLVGKLIYNPAEKLSLALKYCYDRNACKYESSLQMMTENCDYHVLPGTEVNRMGAILEYFPLSGSYRNFVRLHATGYYDWGNNTDPEGTVVDGHVFVSFGATVKLDFLKIKH